MKSIFRESKKKWNRFHAWESRQKIRADGGKTFGLIGEWVDFFLLRHSHSSQKPDTRGIQKMHERLSCLS